jgi:hypothetical protein
MNTLSNLMPYIYQALDTVAREMVGFIPAVSKDTGAERAALGEVIQVPITTAQVAQDVISGVIPPDTGDQTVGTVAMTISKSKFVPIRWNGEQQKGVRNSGMFESIVRDQFTQAFRTLTNMVETDLFNVTYQNASRGYGTAGTAPFGTAGDLSDAANLRKILDDNGVPQSDLHLVLGSSAVAQLRGKQSLLLKANEEGDNTFRRTGQISVIPIDGFALHNSNAIQQVTKGTGAGYVTSGSTAVGVDPIALISGTGTVLAGDIVTFPADPNNKYVVNAGVTAPGTVSIGNPGARILIPTGNALTVGNNYTPNMGFHRSAVQLIARPPAMPMDMSGRPADLAEDVELVTDPVSGLTFEVAMYRGYRQMMYSVALAWGTAVTKPEFIATLIA